MKNADSIPSGSFFERMFRQVSPHKVGLFRIGMGIILMVEIGYMFKLNFIQSFITAPRFLFQYEFMPMEPMSENGLFWLMVGLMGAALLITLGLFYRWACLFFFFGFSYLFLLDKGYYNNHLYLICLLTFLMSFIPADAAFSLRNKVMKSPPGTMRNWHVWILQFQIVVVYFFGGLAKLNPDWLINMEPARTILAAKGFTSDFAVYFVVYGGMVFDLVIGFMLLFRKTRVIAVIGVVIFNVSNHMLFDDINIFPFFMLLTTVLFLDAEGIAAWFKKRFNYTALAPDLQPQKAKKAVVGLVAVYVLIQVILPLRHYFIPGNVEWTGEGQRFAWRMKIQTRTTHQWQWGIFDLNKNTIYPVDEKIFLNDDQIAQMRLYPKMMLDFAHFLAKDAKERHGIQRSMVKLNNHVSMNGRPPAPMVDMNTDLLTLQWEVPNKWIGPLPELHKQPKP